MESFLLEHPGIFSIAYIGMWFALFVSLGTGLRLLLKRARTTIKGGSILLAFAVCILVITFLMTNFLIKGRTVSARPSCPANLKQIDGAKSTWALEYKKQNADVPTDADLFGETNYIKMKPECPLGGIYTLGAVGESARCSVGITNIDHRLP